VGYTRHNYYEKVLDENYFLYSFDDIIVNSKNE